VGESIHILANQKLKVEHLALAMEDRGFLPGLEGLGGRICSILQLLGSGLRNQSDNVLGGLLISAGDQHMKNDEYP
jgi:hypothetical protein